MPTHSISGSGTVPIMERQESPASTPSPNASAANDEGKHRALAFLDIEAEDSDEDFEEDEDEMDEGSMRSDGKLVPTLIWRNCLTVTIQVSSMTPSIRPRCTFIMIGGA